MITIYIDALVWQGFCANLLIPKCTQTPQPPKATRVTRCHVVPCFRCRRLLTANERSAKKGRSARTTQQVRPCGWAGCRPPTMGRKGCQTHKRTRGANGGAGCTATPARQGTDSWNGLGVGPVFGLSLSHASGGCSVSGQNWNDEQNPTAVPSPWTRWMRRESHRRGGGGGRGGSAVQ